MPQIGEIREGKEIGKKAYSNKFIWHACEECSRERWVRFIKGHPVSLNCRGCTSAEARQGISRAQKDKRSGEQSYRWKGGRTVTRQGYIQIWLSPDDFFYPMANHAHYVLEHRLVVAKALGRCLHPWEVVHHRHDKYPAGSIEDKQDNRYPENLQLVSDLGHKQLTRLEEKIDSLLESQRELRAEIRLLRLENKTLRGALC